MNQHVPKTMRAAAIDHFGPADNITLQNVPVPDISPDEVLIEVVAAGVGSWDATEREGHYDGAFGMPSTFPYILGWDGAGVVAAIGSNVQGFAMGDKVYAASMPLPKGGFYAQYKAVNAEHVAHIPNNLTMEQAAAMPWCALTALSGLDTLELQKGETIMILGASGGIGHIAVQLAKNMGARVFAVASGADGVKLATQLGADEAIDGVTGNVIATAKKFAPEGIDAALALIGGEAVDTALAAVRDGGRVAYPEGVWPVPRIKETVNKRTYNGDTSRNATDRLNTLIESGSFAVHIDKTFPLEHVVDAHKMLGTHYIGKIVLKMRRPLARR